MKVQRKGKKQFLIFVTAILILAVISLFNRSFAMKHYQEVDFQTGLVTASALNVRTGPSLSNRIISKVYKNEYIRVFAKIGNWYVVQTEKDIVGAVYADYVKPIYPETQESSANATEQDTQEQGNTTQENSETKENQEVNANNAKQEDSTEQKEIQTEEAKKSEQEVSTQKQENSEPASASESYQGNTTELTKDEKEVLDLINEKRKEAGLNELLIDDDLQNVCRLKAKEMVDLAYFSHNSPTYGTPFEMLKSEGITYKVAGENIAGNAENAKAVDAWMNSESHKANIINNSFNYTGIAVVKSPKYGKIFVQVFIGR